MKNEVIISTCPHPLSSKRVDRIITEGSSISDILDICKIPKEAHTRITINGNYLRTDNHARIVKAGDVVSIRVVPSGGGDKNIFATIASIIVIAAAAWVAPIATAAYGAVIGAAVGAATMVVGTLLVNAVFPPPSPDMGGVSSSTTESQIYSISGVRNTVSPYGVRPQILGTHRFTPPYGAVPYTELVGDDQYLRLLFDFGYGPLTISDIRIGETSIDEFDDVEYEIFEGYPGDGVPSLYTNDIYEDTLSINLLQDQEQIRTTQPDANEISVDITFQGLIQFLRDGGKRQRTVSVSVSYAPTGTSNWVAVPGFEVTEKSSTVVRRSIKWAVPTGQYDIRLIRTTPEAAHDKIIDASYWTNLKTIKHISPINLETKPALLAMRIKATEQLNGIIDQLNAICTLNCLDWDTGTSTWVERETNNPASIFRYVLQGAANHRPLADSLIDLESLQNWHVFCHANGLAFDHVKDYRSSIWETLDIICSAGRGSTTRIDGRLGVIYDYLQTTPIQHFTPRNSWDFSSNKKFISPIHGWKVQYVSEHEDWREDERIVYDDGYSETNATKFETLKLPGVTNQHAAWKHGKYHAASLRLRPEMYSFYTDIEYLVCTRGDLIKLAHDVILVGLGVGRVKSVTENDGYVETVTTDEIFTMESGKTYCIRARQPDGTSVLSNVDTLPGDSNILSLTTPVLIANAPAIGNLIMFGECGSETVNCIIKSISPSNDLTAQIVCVDQAPDIYNSDSGTIPPFTSPLTSRLTLPTPVIYSVASDKRAVFNNFIDPIQIRILVELTPPSGKIETIQAIECQYRVVNSTSPWQSQTFSAGSTSLYLINVESGIAYDIRIRYLSVVISSEWAYQLDHLVTGLIDQPTLLPRISGLELFEAGNGDEFTGNHAKFIWRAVSATNSYDIDESELGMDDGALDLYFKDYEIRIYDGATLLRTEHTTDNSYTYIYEKNVEDYKANHDGASGAYRTFTIEVYMRGIQNQLSDLPAKMTAANPAPELPTGISTRTSFKTIFLSYIAPTDLDFQGVRIWIDISSSFTKDAATLIYEGPDTTVVIDQLGDDTQLVPGTAYYVAIESFDAFGYLGTTSVEIEVTTEHIITTDLIDSAITTIKLADAAVNTDKLSNLSVEASKLAESSVTTTKIANLAVGSAAIANLAVTNSKIGNLAVDTAQITDLAVDNAKIANLAVNNAKISDLLVDKILSGTITGKDFNVTTDGRIRSGQTNWNTGTGWWLGHIDGYTKMSVGSPTGNGWDWSAETGTMNYRGVMVFQAGSTGYQNLADKPTDLSGINSTEGTKLSGIADNADVTGDNTAQAITDQGSLATLSTVELAQLGTTVVVGGYIKTSLLTADNITTGNLTGVTIGIGTGDWSTYAFSVNSIGDVIADAIHSGRIHIDNSNTGLTLPGIESFTYQDDLGVLGSVVSSNSSGNAHGVRGENNYAGVGTKGLIGARNGFDFYAESSGGYGPFTGAHEVLLLNTDKDTKVGDIIVDIKCVERKSISDTVFEARQSVKPNQVSIGVLTRKGLPLKDTLVGTFIVGKTFVGNNIKGNPIYQDKKSYKHETVKDLYNVGGCNSLGEGQVYVCGEGGDIVNGDLIATSSIPGKGMKQSDNIVRSYTVAKARESVTFDHGKQIKLVACVYLCG